MKLTILGSLLIAFSFNVKAAFIATPNGIIDSSKPTRIIVAGIPEKLGSMFVYSSITKAQTFLEKNKDEQIIMVGRNEELGAFQRAGYKVVSKDNGQLKQESIGKAIAAVKRVKSLDIYALQMQLMES